MFLGRHLSLRYKARQFLAIRTDPGDAFTLVKPFAREYLRLAVLDRGQRVAILGKLDSAPRSELSTSRGQEHHVWSAGRRRVCS